ncbi:MAG: PilT domain-containing protein [bacterium]|nr:MAG: PilT domain-containing protein [bacterium]
MILVDANLLIYAVNADSPHHKPARRWLEQALSGTEECGFAWIVLLAFLRITTRPGILSAPLKPERAVEYVDSWLQQPCARPVAPGPTHWSILRLILSATGTAGNLSSDAHLAALAIEHGATLCSTDNDFRRFSGLRHENPLS